MKEVTLMHVATHLIKIKGKIDKNIWTKEKLKDYILSKIGSDILRYYHTDLELFRIDDKIVDVWVYISALPSEVSQDIICNWLNFYIKEDGIDVISFEVEKRFDLTDPKDLFVVLI
jgi:hypothetical protein